MSIFKLLHGIKCRDVPCEGPALQCLLRFCYKQANSRSQNISEGISPRRVNLNVPPSRTLTHVHALHTLISHYSGQLAALLRSRHKFTGGIQLNSESEFGRQLFWCDRTRHSPKINVIHSLQVKRFVTSSTVIVLGVLPYCSILWEPCTIFVLYKLSIR
jgi:hypothetical protein